MPYIKKHSADEIKEAANILEVIESCGLKPEKRGVNWFISSPFADDKTPSFQINTKKNRFRDYSTGKYGDSVSFLMEHKNLKYNEALEAIAQDYGITPEYEKGEVAEKKMEAEKRKLDLRPVLKMVIEAYQKELLKLHHSHPAWVEIKRRGYTIDTVIEWGMGYAPGSNFVVNLLKKENKLQQGKLLGLIKEKEGRTYDTNWNKLIYTISDSNEFPVGIAARDLQNGKVKWINSPESELYQKEKILYGLEKNGSTIYKSGIAILVEGYNDVITPFNCGNELCVASAGTSLTEKQAKQLKRYCDQVAIWFDPDKAGTKAVMRSIPILIKEGFSVYILNTPDFLEEGKNYDPDDFCRKYFYNYEKLTFGKADWKPFLDTKTSGFAHFLNAHLGGDIQQEAKGIHTVVDLIKEVKNETQQEIFIKAVVKNSSLTEKSIKELLNKKIQDKENDVTEYTFPTKEAEKDKDLLIPTIENYNLFMHGNKIYMLRGKQKPFHFSAVSNFSISYLQHIQDEKQPSKLIKVSNTKGRQAIFDAPNSEVNSPYKFDDTVSGFGNFFWDGDRSDFQNLKRYLFDHMGQGSKIDVLGWQPQGFWVMNNQVTIPGKGLGNLNDHGVLKIDDKSYYIPSANKLYENNPKRFSEQKKVIAIQNKQSFFTIMEKVLSVHRSHGITAILHSISSLFLDVVTDRVGYFPLLFFYGPRNTGKDEIVDFMLRFFGKPQTPLSLSNNASTVKAKVATFAQYSNMLAYLSEYVAGNQTLNEFLKDLWGRIGYKRRTMDSGVSTEMIPILCAAVITGNQYPDDEPLLSRCIIEEMLKTDFSAEETKNFDETQTIIKEGFSSAITDLVHHRQLWEDDFYKTYKVVKTKLKEKLELICGVPRMINNAAIYGTCYKLMNKVMDFPFTYEDFENHIIKVYTAQMRKMNTGSILEKFWNLFLAQAGKEFGGFTHGKEYSIKADILTFSWRLCYTHISGIWYNQYTERAPGEDDLLRALKQNEDLYIGSKNSHYYGTTDGTKNKTSGIQVKLSALNISGDLLNVANYKEQKEKAKASSNAAENTSTNQNDKGDDLPF